MLAWQHPTLYFIANGWTVPDYYNYAAYQRSHALTVRAVNLIPGIEIQNMNGFVGHK